MSNQYRAEAVTDQYGAWIGFDARNRPRHPVDEHGSVPVGLFDQ
jgi:hypothetical protein